jgi:hypothetical protein
MMTQTSLKQLFVLFAFVFFSIRGSTQDHSHEIVEAFKAKMEKVQKYTADMTIKVDVDFIKIKERKAKITFTAPDEYDLDTEGFALIPKNSMAMESVEMLNEGYTSIGMGQEVIEGITTDYIKVIPTNSSGKIILAEMWIDPSSSLIRKMRSYTKKNGSFTLTFYYDNHPFDLPDSILIEFDIKNNKLPASIAGNFEALTQTQSDEIKKGSVTITYSNYVVNQ